MPSAAPIRPLRLVSTLQGVKTSPPHDLTPFRDALQVFSASLRKPARRYGYHGLKIFTSLALRFQDFQRLNQLAPVTAVRGNNDKGDWAEALPVSARLTLAKAGIYLIHVLAELDLDPAVAGIRVVISGHSHRPALAERNGVLYVNPGSAGPRRFKLPVTVAELVITDQVQAGIIPLQV